MSHLLVTHISIYLFNYFFDQPCPIVNAFSLHIPVLFDLRMFIQI